MLRIKVNRPERIDHLFVDSRGDVTRPIYQGEDDPLQDLDEFVLRVPDFSGALAPLEAHQLAKKIYPDLTAIRLSPAN